MPSRCPAGRPTSPSTSPSPTPRSASAPTSPSTTSASTAGQQRRRRLARDLRRGRLRQRPAPHGAQLRRRLRLTEALLPLLRASAPSAIVNVASTAGRVSRARTGAYSASKFALIGWSDSLYAEERPHGVHVGLVLPGFVATEGFPATELREKALTRWIVSKPETVAEAIVDAGPGGKAERYVPRPYAMAAVLRIVAPRLVRRVLSGGAASSLTTSTAAERPGAQPPGG